MSTEFNKLVDWIIGSLSVDPEAWEIDAYNARHDNGVQVWIANGAYGLTISGVGYKIGGVTGFSVFFGWLGWRGRILRAVNAAAVKKLLGQAGETP